MKIVFSIAQGLTQGTMISILIVAALLLGGH